MISFPSAFLAVVLTGLFWFALASRKRKVLASPSWEEMIGRLEEVPIAGISRIARDYLEPSQGQLAIPTAELWVLINGEEGVQSMRANAEILIALAAFAGQWNPEESAVVWERMRRDGLTLRRAARRLRFRLAFGGGKVTGPFYVQEAASAYWLMRERLLKLYQTSHVARYPALAEIL